MVSLGEHRRDRGLGHRSVVTRLLDHVDRRALRAADVVVLDTIEQGAASTAPTTSARSRGRLPTGSWVLGAPVAESTARANPPRRFFGLYTPLQGAPTIGSGACAPARPARHRGDDDRERLRPRAHQGEAAPTTPTSVDRLGRCGRPAAPVALHHVRLGSSATAPRPRGWSERGLRARRRRGVRVVTSSTPVQQRALGDTACHAPPADRAELARCPRLPR